MQLQKLSKLPHLALLVTCCTLPVQGASASASPNRFRGHIDAFSDAVSEHDARENSTRLLQEQVAGKALTTNGLAEESGIARKMLNRGPNDITQLPSDAMDKIWPERSEWSYPVETFVAFIWITMVASTPFIVMGLEGKSITRTQITLFGIMWVTFFGGVYLFTNVLIFESDHFSTRRHLTIIEAVYFMAQILTTVGYGDITPAKAPGQVFVAFYVLISLLILTNVIAEVADILSERSKKMAAQMAARDLMTDERDSRFSFMGFLVSTGRRPTDPCSPRSQSAKIWTVKECHEAVPVDITDLVYSTLVYVTFAAVGCAFFHLYPGEDKTVFEGIYMSIITLSTVGFGAVTPQTEAGKVFAAFWMLFGSTALVALVGNFTALKEQLKDRERYDPVKEREHLQMFLNVAPEELDRYAFLKYSLMKKELVKEEEINEIDRFFDILTPRKEGLVSKDALIRCIEAVQAGSGAEGTSSASLHWLR